MPRIGAPSSVRPLPPSLLVGVLGCRARRHDRRAAPVWSRRRHRASGDMDGSVRPGSGGVPPPRPRPARQGAEAGQAREVRCAQVGRSPPTLVSRQTPVGVDCALEAGQEGRPGIGGQRPRIVPRMEQVGADPAPEDQIVALNRSPSSLRHATTLSHRYALSQRTLRGPRLIRGRAAHAASPMSIRSPGSASEPLLDATARPGPMEPLLCEEVCEDWSSRGRAFVRRPTPNLRISPTLVAADFATGTLAAIAET